MNVSVIIATYGDPEWVTMASQRAAPSVRDQEEHQLIIHHEREATIASSRNAAAELATGDWLCFCDADDELAPGYLGAMRQAFEQERTNGGPILLTPAVDLVRRGKHSKPVFFDRGIPLHTDNWLVLGTIVQKDLFLEVGGFPDYEHGFEDWGLWAKCWKAGARIVKVPDAVYVYHHNPLSKHNLAWRNRREQVATHNRIRKELFPERR